MFTFPDGAFSRLVPEVIVLVKIKPYSQARTKMPLSYFRLWAGSEKKMIGDLSFRNV